VAPALVPRDPQQPAARQPHALAAQQRAVRPHEHLLRHVLGIRRRPQLRAAEAEDVVGVALEEERDLLVGTRPGCGDLLSGGGRRHAR
jgi:hypothetical protein